MKRFLSMPLAGFGLGALLSGDQMVPSPAASADNCVKTNKIVYMSAPPQTVQTVTIPHDSFPIIQRTSVAYQDTLPASVPINRDASSILPVWQFGGNPINFPDSLRRKLDAGFQNVFGISLDSALTEVRHPDDLTLVALQDKRKSDFAFSVLTYGRINAGTYKEGDTLSLQLTRIGEDPDDSRGFHILDRDIMAQQQYVIVAIRSLADDGKAYNQLDTPSDTLQTSASDSTAFQGEETYGIDTDKRQEFAAEATGLLTKEPLQHYAIAIMIPNHTDGVTFNVNQSNDHTGAAVIGTLDVENVRFLLNVNKQDTVGAGNHPVGFVLRPIKRKF